MAKDHKVAYDILHEIYQKHRRKYPENANDYLRMCLMWSTNDPPDFIEDTPPFNDIADAFGISINVDDAMELYDMYLDEATIRIIEMQQQTLGVK